MAKMPDNQTYWTLDKRQKSWASVVLVNNILNTDFLHRRAETQSFLGTTVNKMRGTHW